MELAGARMTIIGSDRTSLYEIFTPLWCFESTTFKPSGVGGKYCAAEVPTKRATIHLDAMIQEVGKNKGTLPRWDAEAG